MSNANNKTRKVAVYPNGERYVIRRSGGMWYWGRGRASSHMYAVKDNLEQEYGGWVEVEPNPNYRPMSHYEKTMRSLFGTTRKGG